MHPVRIKPRTLGLRASVCCPGLLTCDPPRQAWRRACRRRGRLASAGLLPKPPQGRCLLPERAAGAIVARLGVAAKAQPHRGDVAGHAGVALPERPHRCCDAVAPSQRRCATSGRWDRPIYRHGSRWGSPRARMACDARAGVRGVGGPPLRAAARHTHEASNMRPQACGRRPLAATDYRCPAGLGRYDTRRSGRWGLHTEKRPCRWGARRLGHGWADRAFDSLVSAVPLLGR